MKKQLLEQLLALVKEQGIALSNEDMERFEELMNQKQVIMNEMDVLHRAHPELQAEKHEDLLRVLIACDQENRQEFDRQFAQVKGKLSKMRNEQRVSQVYSNPYDISQEEGVFFDKK